MSYLIGVLGLGSLVVGIIGFSLRNGVIELTSGAMLLVCVILCVFDTFVISHRGAANKQVFNWLVFPRYVKKSKNSL